MSVLERLADLVREDGGLLADAVAHAVPDQPTPLGDLAASGPRADSHGADVALVLEAVHEGYLLHHGRPRVVTPADPDLALLAGDRLYALGLERLAAAGDLQGVGALADVIALCARAHAAGDAALAAAVWEAGAVELGWGPGDGLGAAKDAARRGEPAAAEALLAAARRLAMPSR